MAPLSAALLACHATAFAQAATSASSNDRVNVPSAAASDARPADYLSLPGRLRSPVGELKLQVSKAEFEADGQSAIDAELRVLGPDGQLLREAVDITVELSGGARILVPGRLTSEAGADKADVDRIVPATQLRSTDGLLRFKVLAPMRPGDVLLRASYRGQQVELRLSAVPENREMFAVGLVELQGFENKSDASKLIPVRENDGFEREIRNWRREFGNGRGAVSGRAAVYLKGLIKGDALLTLAYDSEKEDVRQLFQDIDPQALYPVYGDSSIRGVDAQSSSRLYVRLDKRKSYLLYGDYNTAGPSTSLSNYSRSLTGLRGHYEEGAVTANAWVARDTLRQVVDEFPGRGVSGPYSLTNPNGVQGTEKVELLVRDRNQPTVILRITVLNRFSDYEFEPFSGKILFRAPVPSVDDQLNPVSIRVTYEVEQGGEQFVVGGGDVKLKITDALTLGASAAKDQNPAAPYQLLGASMESRFGAHTVASVELARSQGTPSANLGTVGAATPSITDVSGNAARVELRHEDDDQRLRATVIRTDRGFNNPSSGIAGGRTEEVVQGALRLTRELSLKGELLRTRDSSLESGTRDAKGAQIGFEYKPNDALQVEVGVRHATQNAQALVQNSVSGCTAGTPPSPGTGFNAGYGINPNGGQQIDPATGLPVVCAGSTLQQSAGASEETTNNSVYAKARYALTPKAAVFGELQRDTSDSGGNTGTQTLYSVGADYRPYDKTSLYARHDFSRSYTGLFGLGAGDGQHLTTIGLSTEYLPDASVFSEYRLRDAANGREVQNAVGLRNGWMLAEGLKLITTAERLRVVGQNGNTSTALSTGLEYTASPLWKASGRVEWRRDDNYENWLSTAGVAAKLGRDWTWLARNYYNEVEPRNLPGRQRQDRFQTGFAYRPVDRNDLDALGLYEYKTERDTTLVSGTQRDVNILSLRLNWHPSRPWTVGGRIAYKKVDEVLEGVPDSYNARLLGLRLMYDVTNRWSIGTHASLLQGQSGTRQYAYGLEAGYTVVDNLLVVLGYTWRGFTDRDLALENYTNRGWYLGLRYKFDETLFSGRDPSVNKTLAPAGGADSTPDAKP